MSNTTTTTVTVVTLENRHTDAPITETFAGCEAERAAGVASWLRAGSCIEDADEHGVAQEDVADEDLVDYLNNHPHGGYNITVTERTVPVSVDPEPFPASPGRGVEVSADADADAWADAILTASLDVLATSELFVALTYRDPLGKNHTIGARIDRIRRWQDDGPSVIFQPYDPEDADTPVGYPQIIPVASVVNVTVV